MRAKILLSGLAVATLCACATSETSERSSVAKVEPIQEAKDEVDPKAVARRKAKVCEALFAKQEETTTVFSLFNLVEPIKQGKDEFETTLAYTSRIDSELDELGREAVVRVELDPEFIQYNADEQKLTIRRFAFSNLSSELSRLKDRSGNMVPYSSSYAAHVEMRFPFKEEWKTGTNAFGAKVDYLRTLELDYGIFDRPVSTSGSLWGEPGEGNFEQPGSRYDSSIAFQFEASPGVARDYKNEAYGFLFIELRTPPVLEASQYWKPKLNNPRETVRLYNFINADIKCAAIGFDLETLTHIRPTM